MNLVLIQPGDEVSLQAITLARSLGGPVHALLIGTEQGADQLAVDVVHVARHDGLTGFAPLQPAMCWVAPETPHGM